MDAVGLRALFADPGLNGGRVISAVQIGRVVDKPFNSGVVKREDIWITSNSRCRDHALKDMPNALETTLQYLELEYLYLYDMHWRRTDKRGSVENNLTESEPLSTWRAMEVLNVFGKVRAIGDSNFSKKKLQHTPNTVRVSPTVNQAKCRTQLQQRELHDFHRANGMHTSVNLHRRLLMSHSALPKSMVNASTKECLDVWDCSIPLDITKEYLDVWDWSIPPDMISELSENKQEVDSPFGYPGNSFMKLYVVVDDPNICFVAKELFRSMAHPKPSYIAWAKLRWRLQLRLGKKFMICWLVSFESNEERLKVMSLAKIEWK